MSAEQLTNAAIIMKTAEDLGIGERAQLIGIMTAMQESTLNNLSGGDRDSVGLFQQRPSQGWGTVDQLTNEVYAARAFFQGVDAANGSHIPGLADISGWESMTLTEAAQAVQRSGYPDAYAQHESQARKIMAALAGVPIAEASNDLTNNTIGCDAGGLLPSVSPDGLPTQPALKQPSAQIACPDGTVDLGASIGGVDGQKVPIRLCSIPGTVCTGSDCRQGDLNGKARGEVVVSSLVAPTSSSGSARYARTGTTPSSARASAPGNPRPASPAVGRTATRPGPATATTRWELPRTSAGCPAPTTSTTAPAPLPTARARHRARPGNRTGPTASPTAQHSTTRSFGTSNGSSPAPTSATSPSSADSFLALTERLTTHVTRSRALLIGLLIGAAIVGIVVALLINAAVGGGRGRLGADESTTPAASSSTSDPTAEDDPTPTTGSTTSTDDFAPGIQQDAADFLTAYTSDADDSAWTDALAPLTTPEMLASSPPATATSPAASPAPRSATPRAPRSPS